LLYLARNKVFSLVLDLQIKINNRVSGRAFVVVKSQHDVLAQPHLISDLPVILAGQYT